MVNSLPVMNNKSLILKIFPFIFRLYWRIDFKTVTEIYLLLTFKKKKNTNLSAQKQNVKQELRAPRDSSVSLRTPRDTRWHVWQAWVNKCKCNLCIPSASLESEAWVVQTGFLNLILKLAIFTDIIYPFLRNNNKQTFEFMLQTWALFSLSSCCCNLLFSRFSCNFSTSLTQLDFLRAKRKRINWKKFCFSFI